MAMAKSRGSLQPPNAGNPKKCFDVPSLDNKEIEYSTVPINTSPSKGLNAEEYVKRTVSDLGVTTKDSEDIATMLAYVEGSTITVTFYTQLVSDSYGRSTYNTFSESLDPIHQNYRKIVNFQMKLKDQVQFQYNQEKTQSGVEGEAVLYPYFCPYQGDMFIYDSGNGKLGLYKVTEAPQRHSIETATCHSIKFILITWVTEELLAKLNACVTDVAYFNLTNYLNSQGALLTSDESKLEEDVKKALAVLTHHYIAEFLEQRIYRTFIENACLYDPYIVEFCMRLFDSKDLPIYPIQLKPNPKHWSESFWHMLLDPAYTPEEIVVKFGVKRNYGVNFRTTGVTALTNRCFIELEKNIVGAKPYPPFIIPTKFDQDEITVPMQVRLYLSQNKVYPAALLALSKEMLTVRRISAFYFIPIVIFLLKKLLAALQSGDKSIIYQEEKEQTTGCICDCDDCIFNCNPPHLKYMNKCPGHSHIQCSFSSDCNSIYIPPCGGCSTDARPYPVMYTDSVAVSAQNRPDIRKYDVQRAGYNIGNVTMPDIPHYGPVVPVIEDKATYWKKYMQLSKIADYMYKINIPYADYEAGIKKVDSMTAGGCSSFRVGKYHVRCFDYFHDECGYFVTSIPRSARTKYASMSICGSKSLTKALIEAGTWNDAYFTVSCFTFDGINDQGVVINQNVVPSADNPLRANAENHVTGTKPGYRKLPTCMLTRYILDNANCVDDAIALIKSVNLYTVEKTLPGYEYHFMISDPNKTVVVEIVDNTVYIYDKNVMTNFYLTGYDGVTTNICKELFEPAGVTRNQTVTKHGCGFERYKYIVENIPANPNVSVLSTMVDNLLYSHSYERSTVPFWYSEYYEGDLTIDTPISGFASEIASQIAKYESGVRDGSTWRTLHASIYDIEEKKLVLRAQEKEDLYTFTLDAPASAKKEFVPISSAVNGTSKCSPESCKTCTSCKSSDPIDTIANDTICLVFERPVSDKRLSLVVEYSNTNDFANAVSMIDTRSNTTRSLSSSSVVAVISGYNGHDYLDIDKSGTTPDIKSIVAVANKPSSTLYYRYQWVTAEGTSLGWVVY